MADAVSLYTDFKVYEKEYQIGQYEALAENINIFNEASKGTIVLDSEVLPGHYRKEAFFDRPSNLITRQDISSTGDVDSIKVTQDEIIEVKLHRKIGPLQYAFNTLKLANVGTPEQFYRNLGKIIAEDKLLAMRQAGVMALFAALNGDSTIKVNYGGSAASSKDMDYTVLQDGLAKFGDQSPSILTFVMHSTPFYELLGDALGTYKIDTVAGSMITNGEIRGAFGRPIIVVDDGSLNASVSSGTDYYTLGLATGALKITETQPEEIVTNVITGKEQLILEIQGEFAFNVRIKGYRWDTANGGINPDDSTLATSSNWDKAVSDSKNGPGVLMITQTT